MRLKKLLFLQHVRNILVLYRAIDFHDQQPDFCNKLTQGFVIFSLFQLPLAALGLPGLLTFMSLCWIQSLPAFQTKSKPCKTDGGDAQLHMEVDQVADMMMDMEVDMVADMVMKTLLRTK